MGSNAEYQDRVEDDRLITGRGRYVANLDIAHTAQAIVVRSQYAHASILAAA